MERTAEMDRCMEACQSCHEICTEAVMHSIGAGGQHADLNHIRHLLDCADMCHTTAKSLMRHSTLYRQFCAACAEICAAAAKSCGALGDEHHMQLCSDQCARTAELCLELSKVPLAFI